MSESQIDQNSPLFTDVILPLYLNKAYTYAVPGRFKDQVEVGRRVVVQFGKRKVYTAIIARVHQNKPEEYLSKEILDVLDDFPVVTKTQLEFWHWMAAYYCCSVGEVMSAALPASLKLESESKIILSPSFNSDYTSLSNQEYLVVQALEMKSELSFDDIQKILKVKNIFNLIKSLYQKGLILPREELIDMYEPKTVTVIELNPVYENQALLKEIYEKLKKAPKQQDLLLSLQHLNRKGEIVLKKDLLKMSGASENALNELVRKDILATKKVVADRMEYEHLEKTDFTLQDFQLKAFDEIKGLFSERNVVLLHGITSSGKTHIYIKLIEEYIEAGRQVLYLVPEIALTAQLIRRLRNYFGSHIGIYHSKFSANERYEIWHKTRTKEYQVIMGVRSAVFLPFNDLGLIVIDEEHENTFKQQEPAPRYQARDAAIYLASSCNAKVLLGSATPAFETYYNVQRNKYGYVSVDKRYADVIPPEIALSDLKVSLKKKTMRGNIGHELFVEINQAISNKEQVILFQNRRGYAPYLECQTCGWVPKCKHCDISLTYHKSARTLRCHYCGYQQPLYSKCILCHGTAMIMKGFGTEKIEDDLEILFPDSKILRMDLDTTRSKKSYQKIITEFENSEAQILVGTQMVTKGLDFENVRLVGILSADLILTYPDFRAVERCFQLISQVGGRAGRRQKRGKVIIQTFNPAHYVFEFIKHNDFIGFYKHEMAERVRFNYPPYTKLVKVIMKNKSLDLLLEASKIYAASLRKVLGSRVLGPEFPTSMKLKNEFIIHVIIKFENNSRFIAKGKESIQNEINAFQFDSTYRSVRFMVDVDPY